MGQINWTPQNDQKVSSSSTLSPYPTTPVTNPIYAQLLAKILESHDLTVNVDRVAEIWGKFYLPYSPKILINIYTDIALVDGDDEPQPTPRAIRERIFKIKKNAPKAATNDANGNDSGVTGTVDTPTTTPKKRRATGTGAGSARKKATPNTPKTPSRKGKRMNKSPTPASPAKSQDEADPEIKPEPSTEDKVFPADLQEYSREASALLNQFEEISAASGQTEKRLSDELPAYLNES